MNVLVTGAYGFIGRNLVVRLRLCPDIVVACIGSHDTEESLQRELCIADVVVHLAGVNRPLEPADFEAVNANLTRRICTVLEEESRRPKILMASSIQAREPTPYGISKLHAEQAMRKFAENTGADVQIYRLKNVFGKWCRPHYNSVVATLCYSAAFELPFQVDDISRQIELVYIDDVVEAFIAEILNRHERSEPRSMSAYPIALGDLAGRIQTFHEMRNHLTLPDFRDRFNRNLYATYLSYVPDARRQAPLRARSDNRGSLFEVIKSEHSGQIFISRTNRGVTRGNHYHHSKSEKFLVLTGEALVRLRPVEGTEIVEYYATGEAPSVIDIPPGFTHSIRNVGTGDLTTLFWASEVFDPDRPDTYFLPV